MAQPCMYLPMTGRTVSNVGDLPSFGTRAGLEWTNGTKKTNFESKKKSVDNRVSGVQQAEGPLSIEQSECLELDYSIDVIKNEWFVISNRIPTMWGHKRDVLSIELVSQFVRIYYKKSDFNWYICFWSLIRWYAQNCLLQCGFICYYLHNYDKLL